MQENTPIHTQTQTPVRSYPQTYLIRMITEGVWAMAPTRLQAQITHRKMRKASWQPGVGHFPETAVANSLSAETHAHPVRFCEQKNKTRGFIQEN